MEPNEPEVDSEAAIKVAQPSDLVRSSACTQRRVDQILARLRAERATPAFHRN